VLLLLMGVKKKPRKSVLTNQSSSDYNLCMVGTIRTKEKCPCGGKFTEGRKGLVCPECKRVPRKYFLDIPQLKENRKLYRDSTGHAFDTYARADQELSTIRAEMRKGTFDIRNYVQAEIKGLLVENYAQAWLVRRELEQRRGLISQGYLKELKNVINRHLVPALGRKNIRDIREGTVEDFRNQLPETLKPKTIDNIMGIFKKLMQDALRRKDIARMPEFPKVDVGDPITKWLAEEDQALVMEQITHPVYRAFYTFLMWEGCRPGEARALKWEWVNLDRDQVVITAAMDLETPRPRTKEKDFRSLPLHPEVKALLLDLPRSIDGYVFTIGGKPLTKRMATSAWARAAKRAGVGVTCYQGTRHSFASQAINSGVDKALIGKFLGHKTSSSTDRYAHLLTETLKGAWKRCPQSVPKEGKVKDNVVILMGNKG
jgi:integrase